MGSQMVHHIALFVEFFTAAEKATKEDGIQSLGVFIHDLFPVVRHAFCLVFLDTVVQDLQLV